MDFLQKIDSKPKDDLLWNIPEQKQGIVNVIGGNAQNFRTSVRVAEFLVEKYPVKNVNLVLPDTLKNKLPPLPNLVFLSSTESGTFKAGEEIAEVANLADYNLMIGDFSKNSITKKAVLETYKKIKKPALLTRDAVDFLDEPSTEQILMNENLVIFGSMVQIQKIFRAVYYPKMILLTQSLMQVAEALHKFTLSYPISIVTLHNGQILVAKSGNVKVVPLEKTSYSPISCWNGELAAKIAAINLYNPDNFIDATVVAVFG